MQTKRIVCLANSRKRTERCVAGIEIIEHRRGGWIRPVSDRPDHELSKKERILATGAEPRLLDMIEVPVLNHAPHWHQKENWLIVPRAPWRFLKRIEWQHLATIADKAEDLWHNGYHSHDGVNDHVPLEQALALDSSLKLIYAPAVQLSVFKVYYRPQLRATFSYAGSEYRLKVTDPLLEAEYFARGDGEYMLGESYLTISLSEPFNNACYKLAAAVMPKP